MAATSGAAALHDNVSGLFDAIRSKAGVDGAMTFAQAAQAVASIQGGADVVALDMSGGALGQAEGLSEVGAGVYAAPASFTLGVPQPPASMEGATFAGWLVEDAAEGATAGGSPLPDGLLPASGPVEFSGLSDGAARLTAVWVSLSAPGKVYDGRPAEAEARIVPPLGEAEVRYYHAGTEDRVIVRYEEDANGAEVAVYGAPRDGGSYEARAAWPCGASAAAPFSISRRPLTVGVALYLGGEPFEGGVVHGDELPTPRVTVDGLADGDSLAYDAGGGLSAGRNPVRVGMLVLREVYDEDDGLYHVEAVGRLYGYSSSYYVVGDPEAGEQGALPLSADVGSVSYTVAPKSIDPATAKGATVYHSPSQMGASMLYDGELGCRVPRNALSYEFFEAVQAPRGSAGSVDFKGAGWGPGASIGEGWDSMPSAPGTYLARISGNGVYRYTGSRTVAFEVGAAQLPSPSLVEQSVAYDGLPHAPQLAALSDGGVELGEGAAYAVDLAEGDGRAIVTRAGSYTVRVTGIGGYRGGYELPYAVEARQLSDAAVSWRAGELQEGPVPPAVSIEATLANSGGGYALELGRTRDFYVAGYGTTADSFESSLAALFPDGQLPSGTLYLRLVAGASGSFEGEKVVSVEVAGAPVVEKTDISQGGYTVVLLNPEYDYGFGGEPLPLGDDGEFQAPQVEYWHCEPSARVTGPEGELVIDQDFIVYWDNQYTQYDYATAHVEGIGGYEGVIDVRYYILDVDDFYEQYPPAE